MRKLFGVIGAVALAGVALIPGAAFAAGARSGATAQEGATSAAPSASRKADAIIRFKPNSTDLLAESEQILDAFVRSAKTLKGAKFRAIGHTDNTGTPAANKVLSLSRANIVKAALIKRGIAPDAITVSGAGSSEPVDSANTPEAQAKNRRVEMWFDDNSVAHVTWIQRAVEAKRPAIVQWVPAELKMPLQPQFEVRTLDASAGEVTFLNQSRLYLGPESLVVIYGTGAEQRKAERKRVADVSLQEGSVFAKLRALEAPLAVTSPAAEISVTSRDTRIDFKKKKQASTVAVYDGRAQVTAQGSSVDVKENQGTRVKVGSPPEPPRALPGPPAWREAAPLVALPTSSVTIAWAPTSTVDVEIAAIDDERFERPLTTVRTFGHAAKLPHPAAGAYRVRLRAIDDRDLVGRPNQSRTVVVLASARDLQDRELPERGGAIDLPGPGSIRLVDPPGLHLALLTTPTATTTRPGVHQIPLLIQAADGTTVAKSELTVRVGTPSLVVSGIKASAAAGAPRAHVEFRLIDASEAPLVGRKLLAAPPRFGQLSTTPHVAAGDGTPAAFVLANASVPGGQAVKEIGDGYYALDWDRARSAERVRIVDPAGGMVADIQLPFSTPPAVPVPPAAPAAQVSTTPAPPATGNQSLFLALRGGGEFTSPSNGPLGLIEIGDRVRVSPALRLDSGLEAGVNTRTIKAPANGPSPGSVTVFPLGARLALAASGEALTVYGGGFAGVALYRLSLSDAAASAPISTDKAAFAWRGFGGVGYRFGHLEVLVEGGWDGTKVPMKGGPADLDGGAFVVGGLRLLAADLL